MLIVVIGTNLANELGPHPVLQVEDLWMISEFLGLHVSLLTIPPGWYRWGTAPHGDFSRLKSPFWLSQYLSFVTNPFPPKLATSLEWW